MNATESKQSNLEVIAEDDLGAATGGRIQTNPCPEPPTFPEPIDCCWAGNPYW